MIKQLINQDKLIKLWLKNLNNSKKSKKKPKNNKNLT